MMFTAYLSLQITSDWQQKAVLFIILGSVVFFSLAAVIFLFTLRKRNRDRYRIEIPAMQETVKPTRREKEKRGLSDEEVAAISTALAVCLSEKPDAVFRVVSFQRTH